MPAEKYDQLLREVAKCRLCAHELPLEPRPVVQLHPDARILIVGQAPGLKVHETGVPFNDASGARLRDWMGVDETTFYDAKITAILPMAFCYPGRGKSGDLPPPKRCAQTWRKPLMGLLGNVRLTLVIGQYAMAWHLPQQKKNLTETVRAWQDYSPDVFPLPHPSPRNNIWLKKNAWFELKVLIDLKKKVAAALF